MIEWIPAELGRTDRTKWEILLEGVTAVVNCAGALQDGPSDDLTRTHRTGLADLVAGAVDMAESAGYHAIEAASADEALLYLERHPAISIVMTDVEMPGSINGIELAFAIRDRWPPVHIIVVSGRMKPGAVELPERLPFIAKPYQQAQIEAALRAVA